VDPENIKTDQIKQLREFKERTMQAGLVEGFRSRIEFRDKFSQQLERKVRDLEASENSGVSPIILSFLSSETGDSIGNKIQIKRNFRSISAFDGVPDEDLTLVKSIAYDKLKEETQIPLILSVEKPGTTSIGNVYIEIEIKSDSNNLKISEPEIGSIRWDRPFLPKGDKIRNTLKKYEANRLTKISETWQFYVEIGTVQPQRLRVIMPYLLATCPNPVVVSIKAKIYGDFRGAPLELQAQAQLEFNNEVVSLEGLLPNWKERVLELKKPGGNWTSMTEWLARSV
jgi:hypothetical protein